MCIRDSLCRIVSDRAIALPIHVGLTLKSGKPENKHPVTMGFKVSPTWIGDVYKRQIVGGGFGGLKLANKLKKSGFQVVLIDKNNYHQFPPLIYQVASAGMEPVSYTHLLYWNELNGALMNGSKVRVGEGRFITFVFFFIDKKGDSIETVSYTHLGSANGGCLNINKDHWKQYGINGLG